jgi:hypothetical protein
MNVVRSAAPSAVITTSRDDRSASSSITRRWRSFGASRIVWSVVTIGIRSSRSSVRTWLPAFPPKIPYSCWSDSTSTPLTFKKSAARR